MILICSNVLIFQIQTKETLDNGQ